VGLVYCSGAGVLSCTSLSVDGNAVAAVSCAPSEMPFGKGAKPFFSVPSALLVPRHSSR
jgi:hypothetical protein